MPCFLLTLPTLIARTDNDVISRSYCILSLVESTVDFLNFGVILRIKGFPHTLQSGRSAMDRRVECGNVIHDS